MDLADLDDLMPEGLPSEQRLALALCVAEAVETEGFVAAWSELRGYRAATSPLDVLIDTQTGFAREKARQFVSDIKDLVLDRLPGPSMQGGPR